MQISSVNGMTSTSSAGSQQSWTSRQELQLRTLVNQGLPLDKIANRLDRPASDIKVKAAALGLNLSAE